MLSGPAGLLSHNSTFDVGRYICVGDGDTAQPQLRAIPLQCFHLIGNLFCCTPKFAILPRAWYEAAVLQLCGFAAVQLDAPLCFKRHATFRPSYFTLFCGFHIEEDVFGSGQVWACGSQVWSKRLVGICKGNIPPWALRVKIHLVVSRGKWNNGSDELCIICIHSGELRLCDKGQ